MTKIDRKIVKYAVQKPEDKAAADKAAEARAAPQASEPEVVRDPDHPHAALHITPHPRHTAQPA